MLKTIVSPKGQIVIPASIRKELHLSPGTRLGVEVLDGDVRVFSLDSIVNQLHGALGKDPKAVEDFIKDRRKEGARADEKAKKWGSK